jgi:hypothetical protein
VNQKPQQCISTFVTIILTIFNGRFLSRTTDGWEDYSSATVCLQISSTVKFLCVPDMGLVGCFLHVNLSTVYCMYMLMPLSKFTVIENDRGRW